MRGPSIILRFGHDTKSKHRQSGLHLRHRSEASELISCLTWSICALNSGKVIPYVLCLLRRIYLDPVLRVRLVTVSASGLTRIFTFVRSGTLWTNNGEPTTVEALANPIHGGSVILDGKTGALQKATPDRLVASLQAGQSKGHCLWVVSSAKGVRCFVDIDGERLGKADFGNKVGLVRSIRIVEKEGELIQYVITRHHSGCQFVDFVALVAFTERQEALVYSLPDLESLHTFHLPQITAE
jgi:syntaxin-binding protein 5